MSPRGRLVSVRNISQSSQKSPNRRRSENWGTRGKPRAKGADKRRKTMQRPVVRSTLFHTHEVAAPCIILSCRRGLDVPPSLLRPTITCRLLAQRRSICLRAVLPVVEVNQTVSACLWSVENDPIRTFNFIYESGNRRYT